MMRGVIVAAGLVCVTSLAGCGRGPTFSKEEMAKARQALEACLEAWKAGQMPQSLATRPEPIQFAEEWPLLGFKLKSYEIVGAEHTDAEMIRFTVRLHVEDKRGKTEERLPTYAVVLKSPITIARDPMY